MNAKRSKTDRLSILLFNIVPHRRQLQTRLIDIISQKAKPRLLSVKSPAAVMLRSHKIIAIFLTTDSFLFILVNYILL